MSYYRRRVDTIHRSVGQALLAVTWAKDVHIHGAIGCDWLARHIRTRRLVMIECKTPGPPSSMRLTENELEMRAAFPEDYVVVTSDAEALRAVGAL